MSFMPEDNFVELLSDDQPAAVAYLRAALPRGALVCTYTYSDVYGGQAVRIFAEHPERREITRSVAAVLELRYNLASKLVLVPEPDAGLGAQHLAERLGLRLHNDPGAFEAQVDLSQDEPC